MKTPNLEELITSCETSYQKSWKQRPSYVEMVTLYDLIAGDVEPQIYLDEFSNLCLHVMKLVKYPPEEAVFLEDYVLREIFNRFGFQSEYETIGKDHLSVETRKFKIILAEIITNLWGISYANPQS